MQHLKELGVDTSKANIYWARRSRRRYCIPYNEETVHLVGETDDYEEDEVEKIIKEGKFTDGKLG